MSVINVLHVLNGTGNSSISRIVQRIIQSPSQQYINWHIGGLNGLGELEDEFRKIGAQVVDFSGKQNGRRSPSQSIREYIISNRVNIVHTHTPRAIFVLYQALGGKSQIFHVATKHSLFNPRDRRWGLPYTLLDRIGLYLPDHVVAVSRSMRNQISGCPGLGNKISVIYNDVPCELFYKPNQRDSCRVELGVPPESLMIGYTGRIEKVKRIDLLLKAFASVLVRYPSARLVLVGEGDLEQKLKIYAEKLGISNAVIWTGFRNDIPRLLAAMDIYVQPSVNEGLSLSILEAMAAEKAIIATQVGGTPELLENGKTGLLITPKMVSSIENATLYLIKHPEIRSEISKAARREALHRFNTGRMPGQYHRLYESLTVQGSKADHRPKSK